MKVILGSIAAALILGIGAALVLGNVQTPAYQAFSTPEARVGDPGQNLVGRNWTGLNDGKGDPHARGD